MQILFFFFAFSLASYAAVGQKTFKLEDKSRARKLDTYLWYPAEAKAKVTKNDSKFNPFMPVEAALDASILEKKKYPLVLLSHGSGGKADKLFWLTQRLVEQGMIVLAVDHAGNKTGDNSGVGTIKVWERPLDLKFVLDHVITKHEFQIYIDTDRIFAAGHSAGGTTALMLGGAKLSAKQFTSPVPHCKHARDPYFARICEEIGKIDFTSFKKSEVEGDYSDPRVKKVVAMDPGLAKSFEVESLKNIESKSLILIADKIPTPQDEIHSKDFSKLVPKASVIVPESYHMSFLQPCKSDFPKDDPELEGLCIRNDQKIELQKKVAEMISDFLNKN